MVNFDAIQYGKYFPLNKVSKLRFGDSEVIGGMNK